jgi:BMFP domain-containing protein YqiC
MASKARAENEKLAERVAQLEAKLGISGGDEPEKPKVRRATKNAEDG